MRSPRPPKVKKMAKEFGQRIKTTREARHITQQDLAGLARVDIMQISRYERGLAMPAAETTVALANALKVSTDFLLMGKDAESAIGELPIADISLLERFREAQNLSRRDRDALLVVIDSILARHDEEMRVERRRRA